MKSEMDASLHIEPDKWELVLPGTFMYRCCSRFGAYTASLRSQAPFCESKRSQCAGATLSGACGACRVPETSLPRYYVHPLSAMPSAI